MQDTRKLSRNPFTGKLEPRRPALNLIDARPLPQGVTFKNEKEEIAHSLGEVRKEYAALTPSKRYGISGNKLIAKYRKLSLMYWHMTGKHPPAIYVDV